MFLFKSKFSMIKNNVKTVVILALSFTIGFLVGLFFNKFNTDVLFNGVYSYYVCIFDVYASVFSIFLKRFFICLGLYAAFFLLGLNKFSAVFSAIILFYRGLILGSIASIFYTMYGIAGIIVYVLLVFVQNVVITAGFIFAVVLNCSLSDKPFSCKIRDLISNCAFSLGICIAGVLYELLFLTFVLRPITLWF